MVRVLQGLVSVAGRIALSAIFLMSTLGYKIPNFNSAAQLMTSKGIPAPRLMLVGAIVFLIVGSLSVIAGYKTRFGAALILVFLVLASYYFHNFWSARQLVRHDGGSGGQFYGAQPLQPTQTCAPTGERLRFFVENPPDT